MNWADPLGLDKSNAFLDGLQTTLGYLGMIPGVGEVFDVGNGLISLARGNYEDAAWNLGSAIPVIGNGTAVAKWGRKASKQYSVAFETTLDVADFGKSRAVHFNRANKALDNALMADREFAARMDNLIPGVQNSVSKTGGRATPDGWVWYHSPEPGVMRLVPSAQHTPGSAYWGAMHPDGRGGYSRWAIPAGAPRN